MAATATCDSLFIGNGNNINIYINASSTVHIMYIKALYKELPISLFNISIDVIACLFCFLVPPIQRIP